MIITKRKPVSVGEIITEEYLKPFGITQGQLVYDFQERPLPDLKSRDIQTRMLKGKATTLIGVRRCGKTSACLKHLGDLLGQGLSKDRSLYINFEDERLLGFRVNDFQTIIDVFYAMNPENKDRLCYFFFDEIQVIQNWEQQCQGVEASCKKYNEYSGRAV